jgi:hypothetical protein
MKSVRHTTLVKVTCTANTTIRHSPRPHSQDHTHQCSLQTRSPAAHAQLDETGGEKAYLRLSLAREGVAALVWYEYSSGIRHHTIKAATVLSFTWLRARRA